jgi:hypothetical protein
VGSNVAEQRLESVLAEQAWLTTRYQQSLGTTGELSAYARLQAATLAVNNCERWLRAPRADGAVRAAPSAREAGGSAEPEQFNFAVLLGRDGPRAARAEVARRIRWLLDGDAAETVELLVSETVTNAVKHGDPSGTATVGLRARLLGDALRVEVTNAGPPFEYEPGLPGDLESDGRGLFLVDALSRAWGRHHSHGHTSVWFEVDRECGGRLAAA